MAQNRMAIKSYAIFGGNAAVGEDTERTIVDTLQRQQCKGRSAVL